MYTLMDTPTEHEHNTHQTLLCTLHTQFCLLSERQRIKSALYLSSQSTCPYQQSRITPTPPLKKQQPVYSLQTTATLVRPLQSELSLWSGQMRSDFIPQPQATFPGSVYLFTLMCFVNQACTVYFIIAQTRQTLPCTGVLSVRLALVF